jgi:hypothetical protein
MIAKIIPGLTSMSPPMSLAQMISMIMELGG